MVASNFFPLPQPHCKTFKWNLTNAERGGAGPTAMVHLLGHHYVPLMSRVYVSLMLCCELCLFEVLGQTLAVSQLLHSLWTEPWKERRKETLHMHQKRSMYINTRILFQPLTESSCVDLFMAQSMVGFEVCSL